jgi:mono/diheme cytochrome c family protein
MFNLRSKSRLIIWTAALGICLIRLPGAMAGEAKAGKAQYDKLCASCHGADGKGNPAMAKAMGAKGLDLTTPEVKKAKDEELLKVIVDGRGKMPPSGKNLTKAEQKDVLEYMRSLAK